MTRLHCHEGYRDKHPKLMAEWAQLVSQLPSADTVFRLADAYGQVADIVNRLVEDHKGIFYNISEKLEGHVAFSQVYQEFASQFLPWEKLLKQVRSTLNMYRDASGKIMKVNMPTDLMACMAYTSKLSSDTPVAPPKAIVADLYDLVRTIQSIELTCPEPASHQAGRRARTSTCLSSEPGHQAGRKSRKRRQSRPGRKSRKSHKSRG